MVAPLPPFSSILRELGLSSNAYCDPCKPPDAIDVLQQLLTTKALSEDALRSAHAELMERRCQYQHQHQQQTDAKKTAVAEAKRDNSVASTANVFSSNNIRTRHVALRIYYDGGDYSGLAENVGQATDKSVEKALFQALQKAHLVESRVTCGYSRCGRTDRGVSAAGQVVALRIKSAFGLDASLDENGVSLVQGKDLPVNGHDKLQVWMPSRKKGKDSSDIDHPVIRQQRMLAEYPYDRMLNNLLPKDIRVVGWCPVSDEFSARFSAQTRTYRYFFCKRQLDLERMTQALQRLVGSHDFRNFCKMDVEKVYNFERRVHSASIVQLGSDVCYILIHGQAFLWHQIRCIAEILFLVGRGKESPTVVSDLLNVDKYPRKPSYSLADERPLVLHDCGYKNLQIGYSVQNLWSVVCLQEKQWEDLTLAASRIRSHLDSLEVNAQVLSADLKAFVDRTIHGRKKWKGIVQAEELMLPFAASQLVPWKDALLWIRDNLHLAPGPGNEKELAYTALLDRSMGTTYEEKVEAAQKSSRRKDRYESNVVKKRKTKEEDSAFYNHMADQGSSNM